MNPSGPPIQQIQDSVRATCMTGDLCVVSRPRRRSGITLSRQRRRQSHLIRKDYLLVTAIHTGTVSGLIASGCEAGR
jgi:hypothetical protein